MATLFILYLLIFEVKVVLGIFNNSAATFLPDKVCLLKKSIKMVKIHPKMIYFCKKNNYSFANIEEQP